MPKLPDTVRATRDRYVAVFPMWVMPAGEQAEAKARAWTIGLAKQVAFEHPNQGYGCKRAEPDRPISKDSLAQQTGATLLNWDILSGAGSGAPSVNANPDSEDITGQVFEHVTAQDVIAAGELGGGEGEPPPPAAVPPYNESYAVQFGNGCNDVYRQTPQSTVDPGMVSVHSQRAAWDYYSGAMSWDDSYKKHINEFRAVYGLPPV